MTGVEGSVCVCVCGGVADRRKKDRVKRRRRTGMTEQRMESEKRQTADELGL